MADDIQVKRSYVENLYPGTHWKNKVRHMPDIQVTAIYLKHKAKEAEAQPKPEKENEDEIPF